MLENVFEFNGILSSDLNIYILSFDNNENGVVDLNNAFNLVTTKGGNTDIWKSHGSVVENPINFSFQIAKIDCNDSSNYLFNRQECAFLREWLERRDGYKLLRFMKNEYRDTYFKCYITINFIQYGYDKYGAELNVVCNAPYGFSDELIYVADCEDSVESFQIYNDSDTLGNIVFDKVEIELFEDCDFTLSNDIEEVYSPEQYITLIANCTSGEIITIENRQIISSTGRNIAKDFNYKYPRLIYTYDEEYIPLRVNTFTPSNKCKIKFTYRTIRSVMA